MLPPFVRGRRIASMTRIPPGIGNDGKWQRGNVQKRVACCQNSLGNRALGPPVGGKMAPKVTQGGPKIDQSRFQDSFWAAPGPPPLEKVTSSFDILGRPGRSKAPFWTPGGSQKRSKIDMARLARHPGVPKWAKRLSKGGSQNEVEKMIEKGSRNESFLDALN